VYQIKNSFPELHKKKILYDISYARILGLSLTICYTVLRVIASHKVPKEDAQGEEVAASHHSRSQGEQPVRASKKAGRQDGVSIYTSVFVALKEKQERLLKMEKEKALAREAAATSKQLECRCWWSDAPYDVKEDSNDGLNDS